VMASDTGTAALTVKVAEPLTDPEFADIFVLPVERLAAIPNELTVATVGTEDAQVANCVMS
jgi:hypothetical protein